MNLFADFNLTLSKLVSQQSRAEKFSGVILVQRDDEILLNKAYGYANRPWGVKNRPDTRYRIASIAKMFTAVAVL